MQICLTSNIPPITAPRFEHSNFEVGESSTTQGNNHTQNNQPAYTLFETLGIQEWAQSRPATGLLEDMVQSRISAPVLMALPQPSSWLLRPLVADRVQDVLPESTPVCSLSLNIIEGTRRLTQSLQNFRRSNRAKDGCGMGRPEARPNPTQKMPGRT